MALVVTNISTVGREIAHQGRSGAKAVAEIAGDGLSGRQKFGALIPTETPRRDDRVNTLDYTSAPFVAQLIANRYADNPTRLQQRMDADTSAMAYEAAEALPRSLPTGLYLKTSI